MEWLHSTRSLDACYRLSLKGRRFVMYTSIVSMALLTVVIVAISSWWISKTLEEGKKAVKESKAKQD